MSHLSPPLQSASSRLGMVTSPHALATQCGVKVREDGGNAVEAAIATVTALCVTSPHFCGLGGDAFFIIADAKGQIQNISGIGQAARDISTQMGGAASWSGLWSLFVFDASQISGTSA